MIFFNVWCPHCLMQADAKLREEEKRALRYLETRRECNSVQAVSIQVISTVYRYVE